MNRRVVHLLIRGRVQGVGFRAWLQHQAELYGVEGWTRNLRDGAVEAALAGPAEAVRHVVNACREGPRSARIDALDESEPESLEEPISAGRFVVLPTR